jgi:transposase-like protein
LLKTKLLIGNKWPAISANKYSYYLQFTVLKIAQLESELSQLRRKTEESENVIVDLNKEKRALLASKNAVVDKYNNLRKNAIQLEAFRKVGFLSVLICVANCFDGPI